MPRWSTENRTEIAILKPWPAAGHLDSGKIYSESSESKLVSNSDDSEDIVNFT